MSDPANRAVKGAGAARRGSARCRGAARSESGPDQARGRVLTCNCPICPEPTPPPSCLLHNAAQFGGEVALREKAYGIWHVYSWADSRSRVAGAGAGAPGAGHRPRRRGRHHRPQPAALALGRARGARRWARCRSGSTRTRSPTRSQYLLGYAEAKIAFVEDEEQADKVLEIAGRLPALRWVVYNDPRGMRKYQDPRLLSREQLIEHGKGQPAGRVRAGGGRGPRRRGRGPVHDLGHDRAPQARDAPASPAARARPGLSARRAARALRRVRLDPAAALDRRAGLRRDHAAALAHPGQFPRGREHGDAGPARDRADPRAVRAAGLGADLGRRPRPAARRQPAQPGGVRPCGQGGAQGAGRGSPLVARRSRPVRRAARPPRPLARQVGGDRRLGARPRHLPLLPRAWACRCASSTARPKPPAPTPSRPAASSTSTAPACPSTIPRSGSTSPTARGWARSGCAIAACSRATSSSRTRPARR